MKFVSAFLSCFLAFISAAADWPQWRGPARNGISTERVLTQWPANGPRVVWRGSVGTGFSSLAISSGRLYTMGNTGQPENRTESDKRSEQDTVWCLDALTGKALWKHAYSSLLEPQYYEGGPGSTPTVAAGRVYTISKWGQVFCFNAAQGTVVWQRDLRESGIKPNRWGFAGSPLHWNDLVIFNAGGAGTALDSKTGQIVWSNGTNAAGYASPLFLRSGGKEAVLIFAAKHLVAVEPQSGHELWRHPWETEWDTNNPDPIIAGDRIFISSFTRGCSLLSLKSGRPEIVYESKILFNHLSPGILLGDYLYAFSGEAKKATDLRCIHLPTGELKWSRPDPAFGSLICASGKLLILTEKGELVLADASPTGFKPLARAQVLGGLCWTPPALAEGLVYARNAKGDLVCLDLKPH